MYSVSLFRFQFTNISSPRHAGNLAVTYKKFMGFQRLICVGTILLGSFLTIEISRAQDTSGESYIKGLSDSNKFVRREASYQLSLMSPPPDAAIPGLVEVLDDEDTQVWANSVFALALYGPKAAPAIPKLLKALESNRRYGRQTWYRSAHLLGQIGDPAVEPLLQSLSSTSNMVRAGSALALSFIGEPAQIAIPKLAELLADSDGEVRKQVGDALATFNTAAVPYLVQTVSHSFDQARSQAVTALRFVLPKATETLPILEERFQEETVPSVKIALLDAMAAIGLSINNMSPLMYSALKSEDPSLQEGAMNVMLEFPHYGEALVPELARELELEDTTKRERAAFLLGRLGNVASPAIPKLLDLLLAEGHPSSGHPSPYFAAMHSIGPAVFLPLLARFQTLTPEEASHIEWVSEFVRHFGEPSLPYLQAGLSNPSESIQVLCIRAIASLDNAGQSAIPALEKLLASKNPWIKASVLLALGKVGGDSKILLPEMIQGLESGDPQMRLASVEAIRFFPNPTPDLLRRVLPLLEVDNPPLQTQVVKSLKPLGVSPESVEKKLRSLSTSPDVQLQIAVVEAIGDLIPNDAVKTLMNLTSQDQSALQIALLQSFQKIGFAAIEASSWIQSMVSHSDAAVRTQAIRALSKTTLNPSDSLPFLELALRDETQSVQEEALDYITQLKADAEPLFPQLFAALNSPQILHATLETLKILEPRNVSQLIGILEHSDPDVREFACRSLGQIGEGAKEAIPMIRKRLEDEYDNVRRQARFAMFRIEGRR